MRGGRGVLVSVAFLALPAWAVGEDLIVNGHFNGDVADWKIVRGEGAQAWDPADFEDNPASGSLHLTNTGPGPNALTMSGQCIPFTPSGTYEAGMHVRFPSGSGPGLASVVVGWFNNPCCGGSPIGFSSSPPVPSTAETWVESFAPALTPPPGTVAVGVGPGIIKIGGGSPEAAAAAFAAADVSWPRNPACPEAVGPAAGAPGVPPPPSEIGAGGSLDALFDRVRFGLSGTTPARLQSLSVE
jgi:hypothetical protein